MSTPTFNHRLPPNTVEGAEHIARRAAKGALTFPVTAVTDPAERAGFWRWLRETMYMTAVEDTGERYWCAIFICAAIRRAKALVAEVDRDPVRLLDPDLSDLMPDEMQAKMKQGFREHFPDLAAAGRVDETGTTFYPADAIAAEFGVSVEDVEAAAGDAPQRPVGGLNRVH
ncbi:hypothetical protein [Roseospira goensis]|uniref:Uncharacterized protein n=1 Tax=Roseospira goensis TaxID=391922 RepID=A0A7W6WMH5_9PROT|nr:hypothetical protein [Roseospira goensis]MBB4287507.1 hypothetical protein [Roseospira goensis]